MTVTSLLTTRRLDKHSNNSNNSLSNINVYFPLKRAIGHWFKTAWPCCVPEQMHINTHADIDVLCPFMSVNGHICVWECQRQRGLSAGHWPHAYQFAVISLAWLSSACCQLSKGLLWACPLMRGCSHALESIQHSNRSRMAAQCLPIALA